MGKRERLKREKTGVALKQNGKWRKTALGISVSAGVLGAGILGFGHLSKTPELRATPQMQEQSFARQSTPAVHISETPFGRQALPVIERTIELQRKRELNHQITTFADSSVAAMYDPESRTLQHVANENDYPDAFLNRFHERTHVIQFRALPPLDLHEFMYQKGILKKGEFGSFSVSLNRTQLMAYLKRFIPLSEQKKFLSNGEPLTEQIISHWQALFKKENDDRRQATAIFELHTNMFDTRTIHDDELFYATFKTDYKQFAHDLSFKQFLKIKRAINGLYHYYSPSPDVHIKIAEYLGKNASNYDEFIKKANKELEKRGVTDEQIAKADQTRVELVREAMRVGNIPKPKINFIIKPKHVREN